RNDGLRGSSKKFYLKVLNEMANSNSPGKLMICILNASDDQPCKKIYAVLDSTSNEATTFLNGNTYTTLSLMYPTIFELQTIFSNEDLSTIEVVDLTTEITILNDENNDEQEFIEQPENDYNEIIDPITKKIYKLISQ
ncbi:16722_t:CDS:2, partial [Funneliformis geosporum]